MWKQQIKQRLDASVEEILGIFEQTVAEYKQELSRLKADVQQMMLDNEGSPQEWRTGVDQQDPKHLDVKKEREELWTSLEGELLNRKEETDAARFPFTAVVSKSEDDKGKWKFSQVRQDQVEYRDLPTSSSDDQMTAATNGEDCGGAGTTRNPDLNTHEDDFSSSETEISEDDQDDKDGDSSDSQLKHLSDFGPKTENGDKEGGAPESGVNIVNTSFSCSECGEQFLQEGSLQRHMTSHSVRRISSCLFNENNGRVKNNIDSCSEVQTSYNLFRYDDCDEKIAVQTNLNGHTNLYTEHKPFVCDVCEQRFQSKASLSRHIRTHTGQKPFSCDICGQKFRDDTNLNRHMRSHTGEKPFSCDVCGRGFKDKSTLGRHTRIHTGQKPFGCDVCGRSFSQKTHLNRHMSIHSRQNVL